MPSNDLSNSMEYALIIIGQKSSGKTSLARSASEKSGYPWIDTDSELLKWTEPGESIRQLYSRVGELRFREIELQIVESLANRPLLLSVGAGAASHEAGAAFLTAHPWVLFWDIDCEICIERIQRHSSGLYLGSRDPEKWRSVMRQRQPQYERVASHRASDQAQFEQILLEWSRSRIRT